jgi:uncharacterized protein
MSARRHVPLRRCVACREARPKRELIRLVRDEAGWRLDLSQRAGGRGTSLCPACALAALDGSDPDRRRGFRRAFRQEAAAVSALLAPIAPTLHSVVTPDDSPVRPHPNGGMHG